MGQRPPGDGGTEATGTAGLGPGFPRFWASWEAKQFISALLGKSLLRPHKARRPFRLNPGHVLSRRRIPQSPGSSPRLPPLARPPRKHPPPAVTAAKAKLRPMERRQNFTSPHLPKKIMSTAAAHLLQCSPGHSRSTQGGAPCLAAISLHGFPGRASP